MNAKRSADNKKKPQNSKKAAKSNNGKNNSARSNNNARGSNRSKAGSAAAIKRLDIKEVLKELIPLYIIAFVICFMLLLYEPLMMYCVNIDDFWFDFYMEFPIVLGWFAIFFAGSFAVLTGIGVVNRLTSKRNSSKNLHIIALVLFVLLILLFFQGNLFVKSLPSLDGAEIEWENYGNKDNPLAIALVVLVTAIAVCSYEFGLERVAFVASRASIGVFAIMLLMLIVNLISWNAFKHKDSIITTKKNFETVSDDKNFIIFLADAVASVDFGDVLKDNPEYEKVFEDFTYYPDTLSCYPCTRDNLPVILGGALNKNEKEFSEFSSESYTNSPFFKELKEQNYDITLYDNDLIWYGNKDYNVTNGVEYKGRQLGFSRFMGEVSKYVRFKYLPYVLKQYSDIETFNFNYTVDKFIWDDHTVYRSIKDAPELDKTENNMFKFIHIEGAHIPFNYDKDVNIIKSGTYEQKIEAVITVMGAYIERLKENGTYDNSVIILMSDHGNTNLNDSDDMFIRANPMFMVKGADEHHSFERSDKPISYLDLMDAYDKLLEGKSAEETFADIPDERERTFMWYRNFRRENHMEEYSVKVKAWDWENFEFTGNEYDL